MGEQKNQRGVDSLATPFSQTSNDDDDTGDEGPGKGPQTASSQVSEHPRRLDPCALPAWTRRWGGDVRGRRRFPRPGLGRGVGPGFLHTAPRQPGGAPGPRPQSPPSCTQPCGPARPPQKPAPSLTVSPGSGPGALGEKGELTLGFRSAEGRRTHTQALPTPRHRHNESQRPEVCQHLFFRDCAGLPGPL